jgi:hypothetical protein
MPRHAKAAKRPAASKLAAAAAAKASAKAEKRPTAAKPAVAATSKASTVGAKESAKAEKRPAADTPSGKNRKLKAADTVSDTDSDWSE